MKPAVVQLPLGDDPPEARLYYGQDVRKTLSELPEASVHMACTSPPYWGLRDYQVEGQLGAETTPEEYVANMVEVFRAVHRVLRPDGTLWLNLGDTFAQSRGHGHWTSLGAKGDEEGQKVRGFWARKGAEDVGLKPKDLVGIPWRVALALQADGWWVRNAIIWHKKNHLPSPVKDRLTCSYELIFLLTRSRRYFFDLDAIRVPHTYGKYDDGECTAAQQRKIDETEGHLGPNAGSSPRRKGKGLYNAKGKNPGDVWNYPTQPFPGAHFAVWPPAIPERCILAGTPVRVCRACAAPWGRESSCVCGHEETARAVVLDPFSGSGTTGMVALQHDRDYVGIDLQGDYLPMAEARVQGRKPPKAAEPESAGSVFELFG